MTADESSSKLNREEEKEKWLLSEGFHVSTSKTALETNRHPLKPDSARIVELGKVRRNALADCLVDPVEWQHSDFP